MMMSSLRHMPCCLLLIALVFSVPLVNAAAAPSTNEVLEAKISQLETLFQLKSDEFHSEIKRLNVQIEQLKMKEASQRQISGSNSGVYFYVQRETRYSVNMTIIPYEVERLNIGGAMNLATGIFTVPISGVYHFSFTTRSGSDRPSPEVNDTNRIFLRVNNVGVGISLAPSKWYNMPIAATLKLKAGDRVDTFLISGSVFDNGNHYTQFSGILLERDL